MKNKASLFVLFMAGVVFPSTLLSAQSDNSNLLLEDVNSCRVTVSPEDVKLAGYPDLWLQMEKDLVRRLTDAGLQAGSFRQRSGISQAGLSSYKVEISAFDAEYPERSIFLVKTSVTTDVVVNEKKSKTLRVDCWVKGGSTQTAEPNKMPVVISNLVFAQAEEFIAALKSAGNPYVTPDANEPAQNSSRDNPQNNDSQQDYKFVASRHSKIFHKPDCMWAERIKEENLVKYKTRKEAVNDDKRPCKRCEP
jgi:hypothetical protein